MSSRPNDSRPRLGALVRLAAHVMLTEHVRRLAEAGLDDIQPAHSAVFQPLWAHREGARLTTLARASRITKQSMSALVDHLEKHGYVERVPDPADARASLVRFTARGRATASTIQGFSREMEKDWAARVGAERVDDLRTTLEMLRQSWLAEE
jgi:DNA-binding MarR family transcriptional regulator